MFHESLMRYIGQQWANCLFRAKGICGACIKRCPVNAISERGHDKMQCYRRCYGEESQKIAVAHGGLAEAASGCGLCQVGVPCENRNPMRIPATPQR